VFTSSVHPGIDIYFYSISGIRTEGSLCVHQ